MAKNNKTLDYEIHHFSTFYAKGIISIVKISLLKIYSFFMFQTKRLLNFIKYIKKFENKFVYIRLVQ